MGKILSVSIASYNVEKFIRKALDSCCVPEIMDRLEVLVVNDGSTDSTLEIAREYEEKYPQTFRVIDKKNGGYGSTVNAPSRRQLENISACWTETTGLTGTDLSVSSRS